MPDISVDFNDVFGPGRTIRAFVRPSPLDTPETVYLHVDITQGNINYTLSVPLQYSELEEFEITGAWISLDGETSIATGTVSGFNVSVPIPTEEELQNL